jgi:hypothetical protein
MLLEIVAGPDNTERVTGKPELARGGVIERGKTP